MTIVAQIQNLRSFVTAHLSDTVDLNKHVHDDPHRTTTGDIAYVEIRTPFNTYKMAVGSAYAEPPSGAPNECRSLGWVTFQHVGEDKYVLGPKNDLTYGSIAKYVNERELTDALAAGRREMAEASGTKANEAWLKLKETATKAEKWGIKPNLPPAPAAQNAAPSHEVTIPPAGILPTPAPAATSHTPTHSTGLAPFVGAQIIYYGNDRIAGMDQIPGVLVKIQHDGRAACFLMADLNEITFMDNIVRRGSDAGNGRVHVTNCWDFNPAWLAEQRRIKTLDEMVTGVMADMGGVREEMEILTDRLAALESAAKEKPRRGRPPKAESGPDELIKPERFIATGNYGEAEIEGAELASELDPPRESDQAA